MRVREKATLFLFFFLTFCFFSSFKTEVQIPDEEYVIRVAQNIAEGKPLNLPEAPPYTHPGVTEIGKDGLRYSTYPIGQSIIIAPFYFVFKNLNAFFSPLKKSSWKTRLVWENRIEFETTRYLYIIPALFMALACLVFYLFCFSLNFERMTCFISTLLLAFATIIWPYSKFLLAEASQTFFLIFTIYLLYSQRAESRFSPFLMILAGLSFGLLCITKSSFLILFPILTIYWFYKNLDLKTTVISSLIFLLFFLFVFSFQIIYNSIRFAEPANFGYSQGHFSSPFLVGFYGMLFSSGKSFFLYSPITILFFFSLKNFYKTSRREALLFIGVIVLMIFTYSRWNVWSGDFSWGPRFLVPLAPFFMIPCCSTIEKILKTSKKTPRLAFSLLVSLSVLVQVPAIAVHYLVYLNYFKHYVSPIPPSNMSVIFRGHVGKLNLRDHNQDFQFIPEFSPIVGQWWVVKNMIFKNKKTFKNTPWKGLGYNKFHARVPINARYDLWIVNLTEDSLKSSKLANLFWVLIMACLIPLVLSTYILDPRVRRGWHSKKELNY